MENFNRIKDQSEKDIVELRSDTFTKPSAAMLQAMMQAEVGDDVFKEDPTVIKLEQTLASMFGMEAGIFCPSGTMTNQVAIKCHTQPGDEVICDELSHIYQYEGGGIGFNSGASLKLLKGNFGRLNAQQVEAAINPDEDYKAKTSLVSLENTANRGGGTCYGFEEIKAIRKVCNDHRLAFHLDGARLFNALVHNQETPNQYGEIFDSISICLSKGLGAPVGSVLLGTNDFIKKARRIRKVMGGGMRQVGYLAAAGLYALENNVERLRVDHDHVQQTATILKTKDWVEEIAPAETNILIFSVQGKYTATSLVNKLAEEDIRCLAISPTQIRMIFHIDVTESMVDRLLNVLATF